VRKGVRLFNRRRFLSAQEAWEETWRAAEGADRAFLEALVQLACGLHLRTRRGGQRGAEHLIAQALITLEEFQPATHGVAVTTLITEMGAYLDRLRQEKQPHRLRDAWSLPRIR